MTSTGKSPKLPTYEQALAKVLDHVPPLGTQRVKLHEATGRMLCEDLIADRDQPAFDRSAMDGFAVRSSEVQPGRSWPVVGSIAAGAPVEAFEQPLTPGAVKRIATGAPLPPGADAVVPIEQAQVDPEGDGETVHITIDTAPPWLNVHRRASDAPKGQVVLGAGTRLAPQHIGIAATVGATELTVRAQPRVTLLSTGDEVRPPQTPTEALGPQQIRNSNGPMLAALMAAMGVPLLSHQHLGDDPEELAAAAREAMSHSHLVLTTGAVSVGQRDWLPHVWRRLDLETVVHGVAIQPGRPLLVATADCKLVLGLPGNPVSVLVTAHLFVWPVILKMRLGPHHTDQSTDDGMPGMLPWRRVTLSQPAQPKADRQVFRAAKMQPDNQAKIIQWHGSGDLMHTATADGLVQLPRSEKPIPTGTEVPYLPLIR